ncbi:MAG: RES family NAD+ phosphorylase [Methylocystis sp.]|jgi:hypothetical protein
MRNAVAKEALIIPWKGEGYRLIPSRFPPVSIYEGLTASNRLEALVAVENITNPRLRSAERLARTDPLVTADLPRLQNWNHAPFAYGNPEGSLFFDHARPCLELADEPQTALAVSVERRQRFLARTREAPIGLDMRMLKTTVEGRFLDLRNIPVDIDADQRRKLGAGVPTDIDGVVYHPPERPSATCVAVLKGTALGRSLQTVHYRYFWNGTRISLLYAFDEEGREVLPEHLAGESNILAA